MSDATDQMLTFIEEQERRLLALMESPNIPQSPMVRKTLLTALEDCAIKRRLVERVADVQWSGSYAVRDVLLDLLAGRPGVPEDRKQ